MPPISVAPRRRLLTGVGLVWLVAIALVVLRHSDSYEAITTTAVEPTPLPSGGAQSKAAHVGSSTGAFEDCASFSSCISCLFVNASARRSGCVWCATRNAEDLGTRGSLAGCIDASNSAERCDDIEVSSCPAILHAKVPQTFRVLYVGIRKGGPEALVQLHLGLLHWGFQSTLDTRHLKKEKGGPLLPFFAEKYRREFGGAENALRWSRNYDDWMQRAGDGDVMIATETWPCKNDRQMFLPKGARQMQWHLTVWPRRDRAECTIAGHTRYVAATYMRQSQLALIFPYVSPHIVKLAATRKSWREGKEDLLLYDSDTKLKDADVSQGVTQHRSLIATGYKPDDLYALYGKAKAGIDLNLPGGERFIYEATLFDVCVIVDRALNGLDTSDFPIPDRFRVQPQNLSALNAAVDECIRDYDRIIDEFAPLKAHAMRQRATFLRHVRRYFSNSVHVVAVACTAADVTEHLVRFVLSTLLMIPFATIEIAMSRDAHAALNSGAMKAALTVLRENSFLAAVQLVEISNADPRQLCSATARRSFDVGTPIARLPTWGTPSRSLYILKMPVDCVVINSDVVYELGSVLSATGESHNRVVVGREFLFSTSKASATLIADGHDSVRTMPAVETAFADRAFVAAAADLHRHPEVMEFLCRHQLWRELSPLGSCDGSS